MSQRSASSAAAKATAEVSEPPRPRVVMRPSGPRPWKPAMTACRPSPNLRMRPSVSIADDAGGAVAQLVRSGTCQPCQLRAGTPISCRVERHEAGGDVLAGGDDGVVLAGVEEERGLADPADELVGLAGHGGDDDGDVVAALDLALHLGGGVADAVEVGDAGAAEFHHQTGHGPRPAVWGGTGPLIGWVGGVQAGEWGGGGRWREGRAMKPGFRGGARVNGDFFDAHIMHNACTRRMPPVHARPKG